MPRTGVRGQFRVSTEFTTPAAIEQVRHVRRRAHVQESMICTLCSPWTPE